MRYLECRKCPLRMQACISVLPVPTMTRCKQPQDGKKRKVISSFQIDVENYFISEFLFFRVFLNKETSESFAYIHRGHLETAIKKLPATSIREEPVAEISIWDKWCSIVYNTEIWAYRWNFACQLREDSPCTWLCRGYDGINRQTTVFKSWRNGQDYNED